MLVEPVRLFHQALDETLSAASVRRMNAIAARLGMQDARRKPKDWRGDVKKLLILETLPKPINYSGKMPPMSYGGTYTLERVLGTVPVEEDGSAMFRVPVAM